MKYLLAVTLLVLLLAVTTGLPALADGPTQADVTVTASPSYATAVPTVVAIESTDITSSTATLVANMTSDGGGNIPLRGFEWGLSSSSYSSSWNDTGSFGVSQFTTGIDSLPFDTQIFWRAYAENDYGRGNSTEQSFFTLKVLEPPVNFTATQIGVGSVNLTWVMGIGANTTVIRISEGSCPGSYLEGYLVYVGNSTYVVVEDLALTFTSYCIRAWSENEGSYSDGYAEVRIGGTSMLAIALILLAVCLTALFFWKRNIIFAMGSSMSWLALGILLLAEPSALGLPTIIESWVQILAYIFFIMAVGCLLWYFANMGKIKITQTDLRTGRTWETYGREPKDDTKKESRSDGVKRKRREKLRNIRKR